MIKIRPHHVACMQLYVGKGYSVAFNQNMKSVLSRLESGEKFMLTDSADIICSKCPNLKNDVCYDCEKVDRFDKGIADKVSLDLTRVYTYNELKDLLKIEDVLETVCADCSWNKTCKEIYKDKVKCENDKR